jgi:hypothetical protein
LTVNVDRSWRNPNLLVWHGELWAIDHGAALLFQHTWPGIAEFASRPYPLGDHTLAPYASALGSADAELGPLVSDALLTDVVALVPHDWLAAEERAAYVEYLAARAAASRSWLPEASR